MTPASLVFEWLAVEGFVRKAGGAQVVGTPGSLKAKACQRAKVPMSARTYLKTPSVFGFHGVYRRLARDVNVVDSNEILLENGHQLLKIWEHEQGLDGFLDSAGAGPEAASRRQVLRSAVADGLRAGYSACSPGWQGWQFFADHLAPGSIGPKEAQFLWNLLLDVTAGTRGEVFQLLEQPGNFAFAEVNHEAKLIRHLLPQASAPLAQRFRAIIAYEEFCTLLEAGFDWLRWLSSCAGARAISQGEFCAQPEVGRIAASLPGHLQAAKQALDSAPFQVQNEFTELADSFDAVTNAQGFHEALLNHHERVQAAKLPEGKRPWFERADDGAAFVRVLYRLDERPTRRDDWWPRPYRLKAAWSFCRDLQRG